MLLGLLLDEGGRGVAQALVIAASCVVLVLFCAIVLPVAVLTGLFGSPRPANPAGPSQPVTLPTPVVGPLEPSPFGSGPVEVARRYLGVRYVFGGTDPATGLDCSGLVQLVFRQLGVPLPRTAQLQYDSTTHVTREQLQPGDLVFFARTYADPHDWITHVGIYIGDSQQINAPTEGESVSIQPVFTGFWGAHFVAGGRVRPVRASTLFGTRKDSA